MPLQGVSPPATKGPSGDPAWLPLEARSRRRLVGRGGLGAVVGLGHGFGAVDGVGHPTVCRRVRRYLGGSGARWVWDGRATGGVDSGDAADAVRRGWVRFYRSGCCGPGAFGGWGGWFIRSVVSPVEARHGRAGHGSVPVSRQSVRSGPVCSGMTWAVSVCWWLVICVS